MLTVSRRNWWVRMIEFGPMCHVVERRTASLCGLFWSGVLTAILFISLLYAPLFIVGLLIINGVVKEAAACGSGVAAIIGLLWFWGKTSDFYIPPSVEAKAGVVAEAAWGLKNRVCPVVRLEE